MDFSNEFIAVFSNNCIECQKEKNKVIQQKPSVNIFLILQNKSLLGILPLFQKENQYY